MAMLLLSSIGARSYGGTMTDGLLAIGFGATVLGATSAFGLVKFENEVGQEDARMFELMALLGTTAISATVNESSTKKELLNQIKVDHDIYLAGGEMTPFLQRIYRDVQRHSHDLDLKDGDATGNRIDELKMTEAIDRMVAMAEGKASR